MELKDRINEAMTSAGLSPAALARATKSTNAAVNFWLTGKTKSLKADKAALLETATGYCAQWIISGRGFRRLTESHEMANKQKSTLDLIDKSPVAIKAVASLGDCMEFLAGYLSSLEMSDRKKAMREIADLVDEPETHKKITASIEARVAAGFAQQPRKVA